MRGCTTCNSRFISAGHHNRILPELDFLQQVFRIRIRIQSGQFVTCLLSQVSGEYAMLHHGAAAGAFDLRNTLTEVLTSMRRYHILPDSGSSLIQGFCGLAGYRKISPDSTFSHVLRDVFYPDLQVN